MSVNTSITIEDPNKNNYIKQEEFIGVNGGLDYITGTVTYLNPAGPANFQLINPIERKPLKLDIGDMIIIVTGTMSGKTGTGNIQIGLSLTEGGAIATVPIITNTADNFVASGCSNFISFLVTELTGQYVVLNSPASVTAGGLQCVLTVWKKSFN